MAAASAPPPPPPPGGGGGDGWKGGHWGWDDNWSEPAMDDEEEDVELDLRECRACGHWSYTKKQLCCNKRCAHTLAAGQGVDLRRAWVGFS